MRRHRNERGFTLIEVLVALAIIAVAMAAAVRVAGLMTQSNGLLRDKSMAMLAAQSRLAELQLEGRLSSGKKTFACDQGRLKLRCEQTLSSSPDSQLVQVDVQVRDASREAPPLARLATTLARPQVKAE
ncbi:MULTISPECIES: type II secretion system minor pseudopilin GspI [Pseudomonas]|jgi:general secretion pathway protein I|uniref:Type II secretion system protein I n=1 Tax=Pseudomonas veronii TaxID=76761 RepID=A0A3S0NFF6_PSEVE|nr:MULTISPECIES: type II secretion system minor pseudopilin GspI [Pseudomonas]MBI6552285.1 type II secretion system minor pseudopilin GspI [Pseudomonas veronii]MBI6652945.1 type II secretion system minor pseudopilin GspI [Pseudomonas veronii]MBJ2181308.1 type II secretion system minor pseudopilin GspI [Pseudomonas veronii]NMY08038.1 type II secretion system minor pseudopilin GspI [Pseudomonas veronii]PMU87524.1 type II secretion system protein GspI [Pseudomonas sp. GW704-F3]